MNRPAPYVSVVVPAHNEAEYLARCLDALHAQDYPRAACEIIVVDNASTDATADIAGHYAVTLVHEPVLGVARARNAGLRAAKGEIIAFVDADCIPCREWLAALVEGNAAPEVGCFVGEITGTPTDRWVARCVQARQFISQRALLSAPLPVAATGSIAFRRAVFESIGGFDESFRYGEDADFTWRLQKWGGFGIRYNPRALVSHPHPASLSALARRARHEGLGLAAFRMRHADDMQRHFLSRRRYYRAIALSLLGLARYPLSIARERRHGRPLGQALAYPLVDRLHSMAMMSGIVRGLPPGRPPAVSPMWREPSRPSRPRPARDHEDHLVLDLAQDRLLRTPDDALDRRLRHDLLGLCREIRFALPDASVLLTGSLSVGEGASETRPGGAVCHSDYDLVVVASRPQPVGLRMLRRRLAAYLPAHPLAADLDLAYVWRPLLKRGLVITGGRIVAGEPADAAWLPALAAPRASSALLRAHLTLAGARLSTTRFSDTCAKALLQGVQAYFLNQCAGQPRSEWVGLLSLAALRTRTRAHAAELGPGLAADADRAATGLLDGTTPPWSSPDFARLLQHLRWIRGRVPHRTGWRQPLYRVLSPRPARPVLHQRQPLLGVLDTLCGSWTEGPAPDGARLRTIAAFAPADDPVSCYRRIHDEAAALVGFYPHKLHWPRQAQQGAPARG